MNTTTSSRRCAALCFITTLAAISFAASSAHAQIGTGWTRYSPGGYIDTQHSGHHVHHPLGSSFTYQGARYTQSSGFERFEILNTSSNRCEHASDEHYNSGQRQFEGYVQIFSGVSQQSVIQVFGGGPGGPILMIKGYGRNNGSLVHTAHASSNLITNCFSGLRVRVNILHNVGAHHMELYINGQRKWEGGDAGSGYTGSYAFKYGIYGTLNGSPAKSEWRNVKFWKK